MKKLTPPLRVAIVGLGHLHPRAYMPLFHAVPTLRVESVVEPNDALRLPFAKEFDLQEFRSLSDLLKKARPDIAALFLPHADCPAAAVACAKAGVHLMVEKPVAASAAGVAAIVAASRRYRVKFTTGYCWRYHPVAREIRRLVSEGLIGRVVGGEGRIAAGHLQRYVDGHSLWMLDRRRSGGGPMYNLGVHWIDLFRHVLDDEVQAVSGRNVKVNRRYNIEDNSFAHLQFRKGAVMALDISYTVPEAFPYGRDLYIGIRGTRGVLAWAPAYEGQKDVLVLCSDDPAFAGAPRRTFEFELEPVRGYSGVMGLTYVRRFAECLLQNTEPDITGQDAVAALRVVEAVYKAARTNRWVEIPA